MTEHRQSETRVEEVEEILKDFRLQHGHAVSWVRKWHSFSTQPSSQGRVDSNHRVESREVV